MRIPFTNYRVNMKKSNENTVEVPQNLYKAVFETDNKFQGARPAMDFEEQMGDSEVRLPVSPVPLHLVEQVAKYSDTIRIIHYAIKRALFRNGYEIQAKFSNKCNDCGKEYENPQDECQECGSKNLREPNYNQKKQLEVYTKEMNDNGQDLKRVSGELEDDVNTYDDMYLMCIKDYYIDNQGKIIASIPVEFIRVDPIWIRMIADKTGTPGFDTEGRQVKFCPKHRTQRSYTDICQSCGTETMVAHYRTMMQGDEGWMYYGKDEVKHVSRYFPSKTYGFSPIYAGWHKLATLMNQDVYIKQYYAKQRSPKGLLFIDTPNMNSLQKAWAWMKNKFAENPHMIPPIAVERSSGGKGKFVEFVDFMRSLDEMQWTETRNEFRRQVGALYGVMPLFQGDVQTSGGLNSEGEQITITNQAFEAGQETYNDEVFPFITEQLGITDYEIILKPNEEADEMHEEEIWSKKIDNAQKMQQMGYEVTLNEEGDFEYEPIEEPVEAPEEQGGLGGLADMMGGGGNAPQPQEQGALGSTSDQEHSGEPIKSDSPISTETEGAYNAVHSDRRRNVHELGKIVYKEIIDNEDNEIEKAEPQEEELDELMDYIEDHIYSRKFKKVSKTTSDKIKDYLLRATVSGYGKQKVMDYLKENVGLDHYKAELIYRQENHALRTKAREWTYKQADPQGDKKYDWTGPSDDRTTEICENIKKKTSGGVTMDELKQIINDEVQKAKDRGELPQDYDPRDWTPHFQCRHTFKRHFG